MVNQCIINILNSAYVVINYHDVFWYIFSGTWIIDRILSIIMTKVLWKSWYESFHFHFTLSFGYVIHRGRRCKTWILRPLRISGARASTRGSKIANTYNSYLLDSWKRYFFSGLVFQNDGFSSTALYPLTAFWKVVRFMKAGLHYFL